MRIDEDREGGVCSCRSHGPQGCLDRSYKSGPVSAIVVGGIGTGLTSVERSGGLTQEEVAERSGVQAGEVSRIERGKRDPQVSTLEKLAAAVELPPGRLLD